MTGTMILDVSATPPVPVTRLVAIELRKMADTRAGRWLLIATALVTAAVLVTQLWVGVAQDLTITQQDFMIGMNTPMGVFLPVLGVMSVTGEWTQRTALVTFTLEPSRLRVVAAKLASVLLIALAALAVGTALAAVANLAFAGLTGADAVWDVDLADTAKFLLLHLIGMLTGFALGALLLNTAAALVVYFVWAFVLPGLLGLAAALLQWFRDVQPWVDYTYTQNWLLDGQDLTGRMWAQLGVTVLAWTVMPLLLGLWRVVRAELK